MNRRFPEVVWGDLQATFFEFTDYRVLSGIEKAALVFAIHEEKFVLADIEGRGWCVPSGRIEVGETSEETVRREAMEECGVVLGDLKLLGAMQLSNIQNGEITRTFVYTANVTEFQSVPAGFESRAVRIASLSELPTCYYFWDELLESLFNYANEQRIITTDDTNLHE